MSKEIISPEGLRTDGRRPHELRNFNVNLSLFSHADGSSFIQVGNTRVLACVFGPREKNANHDKNLSVKYTPAEKKTKRHVQDVESTIRKTFENVIIWTGFIKTEVCVTVQCLQDDGGVLSAIVNATTLALIDAGIPVTDYVSACTIGYSHPFTILDMNTTEENSNIPRCTIGVLVKSGNVAMFEMEARIPVDYVENMVNEGVKGAQSLWTDMDAVVRESTLVYAKTMLL